MQTPLLLRRLSFTLLLLTSACSHSPKPQTSLTPKASSRQALSFAFPKPGGGAVTSDMTKGRATILLFITTYDLPSQVLARQVADLIRGFRPRSNAVAVVLEAPRYEGLLKAYQEAMNLPYPVVLADHATRSGTGPFGDLQKVPTLVFLDRNGRPVSQLHGEHSAESLRKALRSAAGGHSDTSPRATPQRPTGPRWVPKSRR